MAQKAINDRWLALGGATGVLGQALGVAVVTPDGVATVQYQFGRIYWSPASGAFEVYGEIFRRYLQLGAETGPLGLPTSGETGGPTANSRMNTFTGGHIYWSPPTGAHPLTAEALLHYIALTNAARSALGLPTNVTATSGSTSITPFQGGRIYARPGTATFEVYGEIFRRYLQLGAETGPLGLPTSGETAGTLNGVRRNTFSTGAIYWSPSTGAQDVYGAIYGKYKELGAERSILGLPTSGETAAGVPGARTNRFSGGTILWSPSTGAQEIYGAIYGRYLQLGAEAGPLGLPTSGETAVSGGRMNTFRSGAIYWSPSTGAQDVYGAIYGKYLQLGAERSILGLPTSGETAAGVPGARTNRFSGGTILWSPSTGAQEIYGAIYGRYLQLGAEAGPLGLPTSGETAVSGGRMNTFIGGRIVFHSDSGQVSHEIFRVLSPTIRATTFNDVASTFRSGCPVGPQSLRTVEMNYLGFDNQMHRGEIVIRADLVNDVVAAFDAALASGMPIARMENPNAYGGNDPAMMSANNTSGFNCRSVVGNPYSLSPHSYGTAVDINPVHNPYRDGTGRWWPSNGVGYIRGAVLNRSPMEPGMLNTGSPFTTALESRGWFWGGRWNPGRDYQHFQR